MRNANEMYNYCVNNNFGQGNGQNWSLKHFTLIENALQPDEDVKMCFIGLHNFRSISKHDNNFAYAITNKRIIMAQKKVIGQTVQSVLLDNVNDITYTSGAVFSTITIDTMKERFNVGVNTSVGNSINNVIHTVLMDVKKGTPIEPVGKSMSLREQTEAIKDLKALLDSGALTQSEFDEQKRRILNS